MPSYFTLGNDMRDTCDEMYRNQYKQLMAFFTPLCLESHARCNLNISRMITLLYRFYIDREIHDMS